MHVVEMQSINTTNQLTNSRRGSLNGRSECGCVFFPFTIFWSYPHLFIPPSFFFPIAIFLYITIFLSHQQLSIPPPFFFPISILLSFLHLLSHHNLSIPSPPFYYHLFVSSPSFYPTTIFLSWPFYRFIGACVWCSVISCFHWIIPDELSGWQGFYNDSFH